MEFETHLLPKRGIGNLKRALSGFNLCLNFIAVLCGQKRIKRFQERKRFGAGFYVLRPVSFKA